VSPPVESRHWPNGRNGSKAAIRVGPQEVAFPKFIGPKRFRKERLNPSRWALWVVHGKAAPAGSARPLSR